MRVAAEKTVDESHPGGEHETEAEAYETRRPSQMIVEAREAVLAQGEWKGEGGGNKHHAADRPHAENQEVSNRPPGITDGCENE